MPFSPLTARLNKVNKAVIDAGFSSLTEVLISEMGFPSGRGEVVQRTVAFYESGDATKLTAAIIGKRRFTSHKHPAIVDTISCLLGHEIKALSASSESRCTMSEFTPQYVEKFSPNRLAEVQHRYAPVLSVVLANLADTNPAEIGAKPDNCAEKCQRPRDSKIIVTTALAMLCYTRNDLSNAL